MKYIDIAASEVFAGTGGTTAPVVYVIDGVGHSFEVGGVAKGLRCTVATVPVRDWNDSLTPWRAAGLYRGNADFGGEADVTLTELLDEAIPAIERDAGLAPARRAICGYSLGGLFSLYAFASGLTFDACACLSGSVWYEGWVDYLAALDLEGAGRFAYLSIGSKEKRAAPVILHSVQDKMAACAELLRGRGFEVKYQVGPGNHMTFVAERFAAGLSALDAFLG